ncbi:MAG: aminotransferase class I/II-fold pyridoxal phosphate-dependent enzyme [Alkalispirochaeta sp.]
MNGTVPIDRSLVETILTENGIDDLGRASIREIVRVASEVERRSGVPFIRMEMGIPGLPSPSIGATAQIEALHRGVSAQYPPIDGIPELKHETARFVRLFLDIEVDPAGCVPVVGSMEGAFATFLVANRNDHTRKGTLFIDPGFPVQKQQCTMLGHEYDTFDISRYRGALLRDQLELHLKREHISSILYSNPNNPAWVCLTDEELQIIGDLSRTYDVTVIEDLAYFGMDFRRDYSRPGKPPYQPTVAKYTDNYILLLSASKMFSYAGERLGMIIVSRELYNRRYPDLTRYYASDRFGHALIYGAIYALTAGTSHSAQHAAAAMLKAANDGELDFVGETREYGRRAEAMKRQFLDRGFTIVYDRDGDEPIGDGFFFTIAYPGMDANTLMRELMRVGISTMGLGIAGSAYPDGLRVCVSRFTVDDEPLLRERLRQFQAAR